MPTYPPGVQVSTLTFSNPFTFLGNEATRTEISVQSTAGVVWSATGQPIDDFPEIEAPGVGQPGSVTLPFVDQPGFTDQAGNAFTMWAYRITRKSVFGNTQKTVTKNWQPLIGQDVVDFDNLPGGVIGLPVSAPVVPVTSVAGLTLAVGAADLAGELEQFLPAGVTPEEVQEAVSGRVPNAAKGAASGVAPLDTSAKVPDTNLPTRLGTTALNSAYAAKSVETSKLDATAVGAANGVAPLGNDSKLLENVLPARLGDAALGATYGRNTLVWVPPGTNGVTNRTSLQAAVSSAMTFGADVLMNHVGTFDIDGTVNLTSKVRVFGLGRDVTDIHQVTKPLPTFYVTGENVTTEDFTGSGDGPSFTMSVATFQNYNVIRVERGAHGFAARRLGFKNHYMGILVRNYPNDPLTGVTVAPVRTERFVVEDIVVDGVWSALHGGPFDSPYVNNVRGRYVQATGHADTNGHAPHLVYINSPTPADGIRTEAYYTRGGTFTNLSAWDGPDYVGAAFSFKYMRGSQIDNLTARNCRGVIELMGLEDCSFGIVNSTEDKYPATGTDATRASVSFNTTLRTKIAKLSVNFAATDHGNALRFENGSNDNEVENLTVVARGTLARNTGNPNGSIQFDVYLQGLRNTIKNADITNLGMPRWCAINIAGTGAKGRVISPKINGVGYEAHFRVGLAHLDAVIDYDPLYLVLDRAISSSRFVIDTGARTVLRDRSLGQTLPSGFIDEFERGVTVNGLASTDDAKTWVYRDSAAGNGNANSWQATAAGEVKYVGAGARSIAMVDGVSANGTLKTTVGTMATSTVAGLAARATDYSNYIGLLFNYGSGDNKLQLVKRVAGVSTSVAFSATAPLAPDAVVELILNGTLVSVKVNGAEAIPAQTVADFATVTTHGLLGGAGETTLTWKRAEFIPA